MAHLALSFLGGFQVVLDGHPITEFKSNKVRALLAYLAVEADRPHRREALAGLLWPERSDRDALSNLRYTLASLRRTLGEPSAASPFLLITHDTIQFNPMSDRWLDAAELERLIADARAHRLEVVDTLKSAVELYHGSLLEGFSAGDAAPFEEWTLLRRERIAQQVMSALGSLIAHFEARGEYDAAQAYAQKQVALEPWNEEAHRTLMRALAIHGQRNAALHQFQTCCRILREELGVEPSEETALLYQAIRSGRVASGERVSPISPPPTRMRFVARESQMARLNSALAKAVAGAGDVIFVSGEAGSGKTALLGEFTLEAMHRYSSVLVAGGTCSAPSGMGDPYLPFREILQLLTGDIESKRAGAALTPEHAHRLWTAMPDAIQALVEAGPGLIDTLVPGSSLALRAEAFASRPRSRPWLVRLEEMVRVQPLVGDRRHSLKQSDIFEQVTGVLQTLARWHPLFLVLDDLQWADAGSISLLFHLGRRLADSRILVAAAYRPDAIAPQLQNERHPLELVVNELQRISGQPPIDLDACEGRQFVEALLETESNRLGVDFRDQLYRHTEGNPLFTVELLRGLEERGDLVRDAGGFLIQGAPVHWETLPARVEAVIAERIGRLPASCQALLVAASVEGEKFTAEVAAHVLNLKESEVVQCLSDTLGQRHRLVSAVSLRRLNTRSLSLYRFRHNLFQQYLYHRLDAVKRAQLHESVGNSLEWLYGQTPDELGALAPQLAWHFEQAGLADRAAGYHLQAGKRAAQLAAHEDAIRHLTRGLTLLEALPDSPERARLKLDLSLAVAPPFGYARGFWAPERFHALQSAYEIAQHPAFADSAERWTVSAAVAYFAFWSAEPERTLTIGEQLLQQAERDQDTERLQWAHALVGCAHLMRADLTLARKHLDQALDQFDRRNIPLPDLIVGIHMKLLSLAWQSFALWQLGYPDRASQCLEDALTSAQDGGYSITLAFVRGVASMVLFLCARDTAAAWEQVEALRQSSEISRVFGVWADSLVGPGAVGEAPDERVLEHMRQGVATFQTMGSGLGHAVQLLLLARGYAQLGQVTSGLNRLDEALEWMNATGVCVLEAEAHRLKGELLLLDQPAAGDAAGSAKRAAAEACFHRAIAVARQHEGRWWELRATVSLCRMLKGQSTPSHEADAARDLAEARRMLADIYEWFSEGFDTRDLREARELLEETGTQAANPLSTLQN